jgi:threonine aldolase
MQALDLPVDLRSDTVTRPTEAMRHAMATAPLGDDVFGDDPTVHALEAHVATRLGKAAAVFVPSGVMANQLAVRLHARPGEEGIVHAACHIFNFEGGAAAALSGVSLRPVDSEDGTLPVDLVRAALRLTDDPHNAQTRFIAFENTHNASGGMVVPQQNILAVSALAHQHGLALHLDGARLFNAHVASGTPIAELVAPFDTVSVCLSKGLGAPIGSVLVGSEALMRQARRYRKLFGGGMRQAGVLAAAGLHALEHHVARLADDHRRATILAEGLARIPGIVLDPSRIQTNLVYFDIEPRAGQDVGAQRVLLTNGLRERGVLVAGSAARLRAVTHLDVDDLGIERALAAVRQVMA